jgi:LPXTG-motif cell wall-anchored protein
LFFELYFIFNFNLILILFYLIFFFFYSGYIPPGPDPKPESSSNGWIIAVSVIGGLLVLGGIGFYIWKKKKE